MSYSGSSASVPDPDSTIGFEIHTAFDGDSLRRDLTLVDLMMREVDLAGQYVAAREAEYASEGTEGMHLRDGLWRHVLKFLESGTKLGRSFRTANPGIPWEMVEEPRQEMTHDDPEVPSDRARALARDRMPGIARKLRRPRFPRDGR